MKSNFTDLYVKKVNDEYISKLLRKYRFSSVKMNVGGKGYSLPLVDLVKIRYLDLVRTNKVFEGDLSKIVNIDRLYFHVSSNFHHKKVLPIGG